MNIALNALPIDSQYGGFCLGKVINQNLSAIQAIGGNTLVIEVCNEHWNGKFIVPSAIGFSTPIRILKGATIWICRNDQVTINIFDELKKWNEIYREKLICEDNVYTFTSDKKTCSICSEDYQSGDKLIVARKCDHVFHSTCLQKWRLNNKSIQDILSSHTLEETISYKCPLCREHTN